MFRAHCNAKTGKHDSLAHSTTIDVKCDFHVTRQACSFMQFSHYLYFICIRALVNSIRVDKEIAGSHSKTKKKKKSPLLTFKLHHNLLLFFFSLTQAVESVVHTIFIGRRGTFLTIPSSLVNIGNLLSYVL